MKDLFRNLLFVISVCMTAILASCEKVVVINSEEVAKQEESSTSLTITTRADENSDEVNMRQTRIYIFRQSGECVQIHDTEGEENTITTQLNPGTYTLYAVGGEDLDRFTLPTLPEADPTSVITLRDGKVMDSFFSKQVTATLNNGENKNQSITLERKVFCLNKIEIKDVPTDVTAVTVTLSSFYNAILLDGTFPESPIINYRISLTKQSNGTTWQATPRQLLFPSKDEPTASIVFTTGNKSETYSYKMPDALEANHHYEISSTYRSSKGSLNIILTTSNWDEDRNYDFDFTDTDIVYLPIAGEYCNGYYVVTVDDQKRTAVLLSEKVSYTPIDDVKDEAAWRAELESRMAVLDKPKNVVINSWRLPTLKEVEIFTKDPNAVTFNDNISVVCFCENEAGKLGWAYSIRKSDGTYDFKKSTETSNFTSNVRLRPVIDISY